MTRKTANVVAKAEAEVRRWADAKGKQAAKLADAEAARDPLKGHWIELCLAADVDGADNGQEVAAAEAKMNAADLAIERARLSLAECDKRWTAAKEALAEATYHDAMAELDALDAKDAALVADYDNAARELKRLARALWSQGAAKREQVQRAARDPVPGVDLLEKAIERRRSGRAAHGWV